MRVSFAARFALLVKESGSRYRPAKASGVSESTLQQYAQQTPISRRGPIFS